MAWPPRRTSSGAAAASLGAPAPLPPQHNGADEGPERRCIAASAFTNGVLNGLMSAGWLSLQRRVDRAPALARLIPVTSPPRGKELGIIRRVGGDEPRGGSDGIVVTKAAADCARSWIWILGAFLASGASCTYGRCPVQRTSIAPEKYPATVTVNVDSTEARRIIVEAFKGMRQAGNPVFPFPPGAKRDFSPRFSVEQVSDCVVAQTLGLCGAPENAQDVILHSWGSPRFYSQSYACGDRPLQAHAVFVVHFRRIDGGGTELQVTSRDLWVSNGGRWGYGHGGFGPYAQTEAIAPTGIEEDMIARYLEHTIADATHAGATGARREK